MIRVPIVNDTIPHEIDKKFKAARIRLLPARDGTGIIAGGALRVILDHAGVKNVLSKRYGTNNKLVNAQCVMKALSSLRGTPKDEEKETEVLDETKEAAADREALEDERKDVLEVTEVKKEDVE